MTIFADAQALKIRMYPHKFNSILQTESLNELKSMSSSERKKLWRLSSLEYFRDGFCVGKSHPCTVPFILCDSTPNETAFDRQKSLRLMIREVAPKWQKKYAVIGKTPLINISDEETSETCYIASMTPKTARRVAKQKCLTENKNCLIHPILPMTKLAYGTVADVTDIIASQEVPEVIVRVEMSPYYSEKQKLVLRDFITSTIMLSKTNCKDHLIETFPKSSVKLNLGCNHSMKASEIKSHWISTSNNSTAEFYLMPSNEGVTKTDLIQNILVFIAALAARPEITQIELSYYYFIEFND